MFTRGGGGAGVNEVSGFSFGLYYYMFLLPKPKIRLVGVIEVSHAVENSDENYTSLIKLPNILALLRHRYVQKACAYF
jgi:hypothetical protein